MVAYLLEQFENIEENKLSRGRFSALKSEKKLVTYLVEDVVLRFTSIHIEA